jgi:DNA repair protein RecN (Recombination protein N)
MLKTLRIRDVAIVDDLCVEFGPGLNLLTGETGAGKSILVDALGLIAGQRADSSLVREGAARAVVEAVFEPARGAGLGPVLDERGIEGGADGELIVRREVAAGGGGRVFVNGSPTTVGVLRAIGERLVELHGHFEQQTLLSLERHREALDRFGVEPSRLEAVAAAWDEVRRRRERVGVLRDAASERRARTEALREKIRRIEEVGPTPGERDVLDRERTRLQHAEEIASLLDEATAALYDGEPAAAGLAATAGSRLARLAELDPSLADLARRVEEARLELEDVGQALRDYRRDGDFDPSRLDEVESRRAALERLCLLYGQDEAQVLDTLHGAKAELAELEDLDAEIDAAVAEQARAEASYAEAAAVLSAARQGAAERLVPAVERQLGALALRRATFAVSLPEADGPPVPHGGAKIALSPHGAERVEFLLAANPGQSPRSLAKVASAGELSRVMLALHAVQERAGSSRVVVFDEVDTGVGGAVADAIGARLAGLARRHQVLCVTHLPQVAAYADHHYHVQKRVVKDSTSAEVIPLSASGRVDELARMLGGREVSDASRRNAAALLAGAGRPGRPSKPRRGA